MAPLEAFGGNTGNNEMKQATKKPEAAGRRPKKSSRRQRGKNKRSRVGRENCSSDLLSDVCKQEKTEREREDTRWRVPSPRMVHKKPKKIGKKMKKFEAIAHRKDRRENGRQGRPKGSERVRRRAE